jgi:Tol biopolymer transport system component/DNA-binding winged helix-turn-helix (wHTH) protein
MQQPVKPTYEFGPFRLDPEKRVLLKNGKPVALTQKTFAVLLLLVESHGQIVAKNAAMDHVWADTFVEESNLAVYIHTIRKVLGEGPYIVTIPGRGYQFVASVRVIGDEGSELMLEEHTRSHVVIEQQEELTLDASATEVAFVQPFPVDVRQRRRSRTRLSLILVVAVAQVALLTGYSLWWLFAGHPTPKSQDWRGSLKFVRIVDTKSDRNESMNGGRLSPDASLIVFSANSPSGDGLNLWIRQINGGQPMQVTRGAWHDVAPVWSPNQQQIAFISDRNNQLGIWSVPFLGGTEPVPLKVLEPTAGALRGGDGVQYWSASNRLYYSWNGNFYRLDLASKEVTQITQFDAAVPARREFCISPDEAWVAYVEKQGKQFDLWRVPVQGGTPIQLTNDPLFEQRPLWHPLGDRIIYTARLDGRFRIYQVYLDGRLPEFITFTEDESYIWDISADGSKLLYYGLRDAFDLGSVDLETSGEQQLTSEIGMEFGPQVAPNGSAIVYQALQGQYIVWEPKKSTLLIDSVPSSGRPTPLASNAFEPQWSPDGRKIAFLREANGLNNLFVTSSAGGEELQVTSAGVNFGGYTVDLPINRFCLQDYGWSPDSHKIAYCSKQAGVSNLWIVSVDGSEPTQLSHNFDPKIQFNSPIWLPDGQHIAYITMTSESQGQFRWGLRLANAETDELLFETPDVLRLLGWRASGNEIVIATTENRGMNPALLTDVTVARLLVAGHQRQEVAHIPATYLCSFQLSSDGRNISYVSSLDGRDDIRVLPIEGGEAKKITSNTDPKSYYSGLAWSPNGRRIFFSKQACWSLITMIDNLR